ncbi:MAG: glycerol-3-phosphate dehydrogenase subunit GlpB, partial [Thermodesulfobacteriota bacterium]|nr:glycerol-3-phosphate dehydrogenase subunit GlpB [Thermodesulfobacteriota bacterium]
MADINNVIKTDLTIIGSGMAGMAAAVFAVNRGISTTLTGRSSSIHFASGLMDLMGVYPPGIQNLDPWSAIELVRKDIVNHPYSKISNKDISTALVEIIAFLKDQGLFYQRAAYRNIDVITSVGTLKKTHMVPQTMWNGVVAFETKATTLLVDFTGLKIFSAKQMKSSFRSQWPGIKSTCINFPDTEHLEEVLPEHLSRSLDLSANRIKLAERVKPFVKEVKYVGFPAMLGMYKSKEAVEEMEKLLGVPVFEIPTPPVSVPGIRLQESLKKGLEKNVCLHFLPEVVKDVEILSNG